MFKSMIIDRVRYASSIEFLETLRSFAWVKAQGVYVVRVGDHKDVVECWPPPKRISPD